MLKLYTFNISHFAEKARWTLDFEGIKLKSLRRTEPRKIGSVLAAIRKLRFGVDMNNREPLKAASRTLRTAAWAPITSNGSPSKQTTSR